MIKKQLETNIIKPIQEKDVKHLNPVFVIRKKDGGWRQIVDCRRLNNAIKTIYYKQEDHRTVEKIILEKDYAVTLDLSQAYYLIKISEELSPFISFVFKGIYYAYHGMPFGYKDAPRTFTKVMRKVLKYMRDEWSVRAIAYLDDIVLLHQNPQELNIIVEKTLSMFNKLGLLVNSEKCHLIPCQQFKFLGFQWDTNQFVVQIEESKKTELMKECKKWRRIAQNNRVVSIKKFASLIGKLNATRFVYQEASLNLSQLYKLLNIALSLNGWQGKMRVNASITNCLMKWSERLKENQPRRLNPVFRQDAILTTDASGFATGATLKANNQMLDFHKPLPPPVRNQSSNYRELFAINQAIAHFSNSIRNQEIRNLLIRSDNTTAVYNLNRWGAGPNLRTLLKKIWNQTHALKVVVKAQHIPGERNVRADGLSRLAKGGDYEVGQEALEEITNQLQMHITLDAFATKTQNQRDGADQEAI
ncbi:putative Reverse transcriptase (RNA-dependent DNA polymerase) [Monocercomonoides exilis]|uniref:putative Reverse transcriptase (RNA-dependent DNA polymerase) n=1 Tax=Monocercomonoides exilis TaxID=2049356 RepID=UPI0035597B15|nr:putative Reverse transcriptase (RNA-dependent DNA polymerase) [Monocercomonoides exilis]|eukprot:MONOS_8366.1-p1 / transcript=MONOS_8366.1 / gene=MONOS_8366 / organism=Monocercomonoides_exilis_PA203 / gene_product=ORF3 / transcript_product=ORF3 / location=Mono_scaffold00314:16564-17985(+) / protein_length=473 / sequence_SO=supercontig / SO=protein_coding / is_pseudo=false